MRLTTTLIATFALQTVSVDAATTGAQHASHPASRHCGSHYAPEAAIRAAKSLKLEKRSRGGHAQLLGSYKRPEGLVIPTYLHVIESKKKAGFVKQQWLYDQMKVLNETYAPHNIQFVLKNITRTVNDKWAANDLSKDKSLALRQGGYDELNIYFETGLMAEDVSTGICTFPVKDPVHEGEDGTPYAVLDGCHVNPGTLPGGPGQTWQPKDNKGKLATHEVGHWFGLFHTFSGTNCTGEGDMVSDTPAEGAPTNGGCPTGKDSCPDRPGLDPIHNYMDYADQDCQHEFTPGQEDRMYMSFNTLRKGWTFDIQKLGPI
ncbi:hypothetical protein FOCG_18055 [Fusarium oxysporum f. sp. radicis-lycopersici 26381]|nr:hypothetical protein FOCG_18055 [Fusarium oxysporum f. sp. radicis-lycopersici 26381]